MLRRALILAAPLALFAAGAQASEKKDKPEKPSGQYVDLSPVALPIVAEGQVVNYVFVYVRVNLSPSADVTKLRTKEPFFRDALVRAGHRTPFTDPKDYFHVDAAKLKASLLRDAVAIAGRDVISVSIESQTPKRRTGVPKPPTV